MTISRAYGFSLRRTSARLQARRKKAPVAKKAEALLCSSLGIISNGQLVTEQALAEFSRRFEGQVSQEVVAALRALFKLDEPASNAIDEAVIAHGGAAALDANEEDDTSNV
jgi:ABC-type multidrug transport system ATPase subunit